MATAQDLLNNCKTELQQTGLTIVAGLLTGGGENDEYLVLSDDQLLKWATEGQNRLARNVMPVYDEANITVAQAGQAILSPCSEVVSASGRVLIAPTVVLISGRKLNPANQGYLNNTRWYPPTPDGDPTGWASTTTAISLSSYTTTPTFQVNGYYLPAPLKFAQSPAASTGATVSAGTTLTTINPPSIPAVIGDLVYLSGGSVTSGVYTITGVTSPTVYTLGAAPGNSAGNVSVATPVDAYIDDFSQRTIWFYMAWMVAMKNQDNTVLGERTPVFGNEWTTNAREIYSRLIQNDNTIAAIFPPSAVDALVQLVKQVNART